MKIHPPYPDYRCFRDFRAINTPEYAVDLSILIYSDRIPILNACFDRNIKANFFTKTTESGASLQAVVAEAGDFVVVAFRGTVGAKDWAVDLQVEKTAQGVHRGFSEACDVLLPDIIQLINGKKVLFTGHSLGAALAAVAAMRTRLICDCSIINFGQPRIGDENAVKLLEGVSWTRYIHGEDVVTKIPLAEEGYVHAGDVVQIPQTPRTLSSYFSDEKPYIIPTAAWDHIPTLYAEYIWKSSK